MYSRANVIQSILNAVGGKTYLEIGVAHAETFLPIRVARKIGVDPLKPTPRILEAVGTAFSKTLSETDERIFLEIGQYSGGNFLSAGTIPPTVTERDMNPRCSHRGPEYTTAQYFQLTSDDFFKEAPRLFADDKIDVAFVDGLHEWEQAARDVDNCLQYLEEDGVIVMHDCCPASEIMATPLCQLEQAKSSKGWDGAWTGDVWKAMVWLRSSRNDLDAFVLGCDWGLGIIRRGTPQKTLDYTRADVANLTYQDLDLNRQHLLNLKDPLYINEFLPQLKPIRKQVREPQLA